MTFLRKGIYKVWAETNTGNYFISLHSQSNFVLEEYNKITKKMDLYTYEADGTFRTANDPSWGICFKYLPLFASFNYKGTHLLYMNHLLLQLIST